MSWRTAIVVALAVLLGPIPGRADEPGAFFPVMAWNSPPDDPAVLAKMRTCGITVAGFVRPEGLDHCREAGLKAIVSDPRLSDYDWHAVDPDRARARVAEVVGRVKGHPAVLG